ncbi:MAG: glycosyltransferase [Flavobacteriales bacterium]|nr:glycosyltransferase [Flavobacteriales bacterium]MCB9204782.1 glycosyltransferase [Flavobacteriales bacterium]
MSKRILIAPLDWGLGHATRCIPIIRHLLDIRQHPVIAASGRPLSLLKAEFPEVESVDFEGYNISYPQGSGMAWKMFRSTPQILKRIKEEGSELDGLITKLKLDAVISDNRFGLYSDRIPCVYMTHQVMIKAPFFETTLYRMHMNYMRKFNHVWIPDFENDGLSGDLAHKYPKPFNGHYIGPLSRFSALNSEEKADVLVLISGPEPQRTRFENLVLEQLKGFEGNVTAVVGTPDKEFDRTEGNTRVVSHLNAEQLQREIASAKLIVSRSGYSTIMDLAAMGKKAVFVPTPGQTEQEYLAKLFDGNGMHLAVKQGDFHLLKAIEKSKSYSGFQPRKMDEFKPVVDAFVTSLS